MEAMAKAGNLQAVLAENEALLNETRALVADINLWLDNNSESARGDGSDVIILHPGTVPM